MATFVTWSGISHSRNFLNLHFWAISRNKVNFSLEYSSHMLAFLLCVSERVVRSSKAKLNFTGITFRFLDSWHRLHGSREVCFFLQLYPINLFLQLHAIYLILQLYAINLFLQLHAIYLILELYTINLIWDVIVSPFIQSLSCSVIQSLLVSEHSVRRD